MLQTGAAVFLIFAVWSRSVAAQITCPCTTVIVSGANNFSAASTAYNANPVNFCVCNNGEATGVCSNLGQVTVQTTNPNGTVSYTAAGTCQPPPSNRGGATPPTAPAPIFTTVNTNTPAPQSGVVPPTVSPISAPPTVPPVTAPPPAVTPSGATPPAVPPVVPPAVPPTVPRPEQAPPPATPPGVPPVVPPAVPPTVPRPGQAPPPAVPPVVPPAVPPTVPRPGEAPPPLTPPAVPPTGPPRPGVPPTPSPPTPTTPNVPGSITNINNTNNNNINNNNVNINNVNNVVNNINNQVTNNVVTNNNVNIQQSAPGTTPPTPPAPAAPPTPVGSITQGQTVPPVPVIPPPPAPPTPPECGVQPQCRIFVENKLCCESAGILSEAQYASIWILCTHAVQLPQTCLSVGGPQNLSVNPFFTDGTYGTHFNYQLYWNVAPYIGKVTVDVELARSTRPECTLNISPCTLNGATISSVSPVTALTFAAINPLAFELGYVGLPATNLDTLDSFSWTDPTSTTGGCYQQSRANLARSTFGSTPATFVTQAGYKVPCNPTATFGAILPNAQALTTLPSAGVAGITP